jgi:hypothetical protein
MKIEFTVGLELPDGLLTPEEQEVFAEFVKSDLALLKYGCSRVVLNSAYDKTLLWKRNREKQTRKSNVIMSTKN